MTNLNLILRASLAGQQSPSEIQPDELEEPKDTKSQDTKNPTLVQNENKDKFISVSKKIDPEHDGKITFLQCLKKLLSGPINDMKSMICNPSGTILAIGGFIFLAAYVPFAIKAGIALAIGYGVVQGIRGIIKIGSCYKNKDSDGIENAFEDLGKSIFALSGTGAFGGALNRGLKLTSKITRFISDKTMSWYKNVYFNQLKNKEGAAIIFLGLNIAEAGFIAHSAATLNPGGALLGLTLFALNKYMYMGYHYCSKVVKKIMAPLGEVMSQLYQYVAKGQNNALAAIIEDIPNASKYVREFQLRLLARFLPKGNSQQKMLADMADAIRNDKLDEFLASLQASSVHLGKEARMANQMTILIGAFKSNDLNTIQKEYLNLISLLYGKRGATIAQTVLDYAYATAKEQEAIRLELIRKAEQLGGSKDLSLKNLDFDALMQLILKQVQQAGSPA